MFVHLNLARCGTHVLVLVWTEANPKKALKKQEHSWYSKALNISEKKEAWQQKNIRKYDSVEWSEKKNSVTCFFVISCVEATHHKKFDSDTRFSSFCSREVWAKFPKTSGQIIIFHQLDFPQIVGFPLLFTTIWGKSAVWGTRYNLIRRHTVAVKRKVRNSTCNPTKTQHK